MKKELRIKTMVNSLNQYNRIIIYGTGLVAQYIYPYLVQNGLRNKIFCFTQTNKCELETIDGIPIFSIDTLSCDMAECAVLIATSEKYVDEIRKTVYDRGYKNVFLLTDYYIHTEHDFLKLNTFEEYCQFIAQWYAEQYEKEDTSVLIKQLYDRGNGFSDNKDQKLIIVICGAVMPRTGDIIRALEHKGYRIVMLNYEAEEPSYCRKSLKDTNVTMLHCHCIEEMFYMALQYNPLVYLFEPRFADCMWAKIMLKQKQYFGKIVLTLYDVVNDGHYGMTAGRLETEKYALENADGIMWRWFSKDYLESKGFHFQGKSIQFVDYCSNIDMDWLQVDCEPRVLKFCMAVGCDAHVLEENECDVQYTRMARIGEILEKIGNREDCIFHFYAGKLKKSSIEKCRSYEQRYSNFKLFLNTEYTELIQRYREYDYACNIYIKGEMPPDDSLVDGTTGSSFKNYVRHSFFDYLSAGLPIIATVPQKCLDYLQQYGVVIRMDLSDLDIEYLKKNRQYYGEKVKTAVKELDINKHISKLIDFFKEL